MTRTSRAHPPWNDGVSFRFSTCSETRTCLGDINVMTSLIFVDHMIQYIYMYIYTVNMLFQCSDSADTAAVHVLLELNWSPPWIVYFSGTRFTPSSVWQSVFQLSSAQTSWRGNVEPLCILFGQAAEEHEWQTTSGVRDLVMRQFWTLEAL